MTTANWDPALTERALNVWDTYTRQHDLADQDGKVAAIDPVSGRIWIDDSGIAVAEQMEREGVDAPVYLVRIGSPSYLRKGRR